MNIDATSILDSLDQHVFIKDEKGVYVYGNHSFSKIAGLKNKEDIIGKTDFDLAWKKQANDIRKIDQEILLGTPLIKGNENQIRNDGTIQIMITRKPYIVDKKIVGVLGSFFDCDNHLILETKGTYDKVKKRLHLEFVDDWLSVSEIRVSSHIINGFPSSKIGDKMGISENTVRFHIENIKRKTECSSKSEIVEKLIKKDVAWTIMSLSLSNELEKEH